MANVEIKIDGEKHIMMQADDDKSTCRICSLSHKCPYWKGLESVSTAICYVFSGDTFSYFKKIE